MAIHVGIGEQQVVWRDTKRYLWIMGTVIPLIPFVAFGLALSTGLGILWYFGPFFVFVVLPIVDLIAGFDRNNPPDEVIEALENDRYYRWITYLFIPVQYLALGCAAYLFGGGWEVI